MCDFSIRLDLSRYDEFNNINESIKEIRRWEKQNIIKFSELEIHNIIWNDIEHIESLATIKEKDFLRKINEIKDTEYKEDLKKLNEEEKNNILNYAYWKYRNKNCKEKFIGMDRLKVKLGVKFNVNYKKPIFKEYICSACGKKGKIKILEYNKIHDSDFFCNNCNHTMKNSKYQRDMHCFECECNRCKEKVFNFYDSLKNNLNNLIKKIKNDLNYFYNKNNNIPSDEDMLEDWISNNSSISNELKNILSKNIDEGELKIYINNMFSKNKELTKDIFDEMKNKKIIYISELIDSDELEKAIISGRLLKGYFYVDAKIEYDVENIFNDYSSLKKSIKLYNNSEFMICYGKEFFIPFENEILEFDFYKLKVNKKILFNKCFFNKKEDINKINIFDKNKSLFKSDKHMEVYSRLQELYKDNLIIYNYKVSDIIDIDILNDKFTKDVLEYFKTVAYFDFVICDPNGILIKVIQVKESLYKDNMAIMIKAILSIAEIPYEEV